MSGTILLCVSAAVLGVDYGWQPVAGGGVEYIIQIEPELLDSLKAGHDLFSDLPPTVKNVRSYRITVGSGRLPHHGEPPPSTSNSTASAAKQGDADDALVAVRHPADIDLSQLPGPVLGPALVHPSSANAIDEVAEPPHLAASEAEPLANRVAGYHGKTDSSAATEDTSSNDEKASDATDKQLASHKKDNEKPRGEGSLEKVTVDHRAAAEEPQSPSDRNREPPQAESSKATLLQLGLFASLCSNVFLVWVASGQRSRYRSLVRRMFDSSERSTTAPPLIASSPDIPRWEPLTSAGDAHNTENSGG